MPSSTFCSSQLCGFLSVILPIVGGIFGLLALYIVVRYWNLISHVFSRLFYGKSFSPAAAEMSAANRVENGGVVNGLENGVKSNAASAVGEPQTFVPNFFFLRQNSLNDSPAEKNTTPASNGAVASEGGGPVLKGCLKKTNAADGKRCISKTHPACSPTFETDPVDWVDLGIKLPK